MGLVVVGIDGAGPDLSAVDLAAEEAAARLTPLLVVHAHTSGRARLAADHYLLQSAVSQALADHPWLTVDAKLILGVPAQVLATQSAQACLLVVGHRLAASRPAGCVDSVVAQLILESRCPVLVHRPMDPERQTEQPSPVLLGVTRQAREEPVVAFAFEEAVLRGAPLHVTRAWPGRSQALDQTLQAWSGSYPQVPVAHRVCPGYDVTQELCRMSHDAQLLVVGISRTRPAHGLLTQELIDFAGCPVAVVPHA
jgi:hypothetical protein